MGVKQKEINESEIRKAVEQFHADDKLFEVRIINGTKRTPLSGFFQDADTLLKAFETVDLRGTNVYFTLNQIDESLYSLIQRDRFVLGATGTEDKDVDGISWLFIDLDPERKAGISSTDEQVQESYRVASKVYEYLKKLGFEEPVKAISGNGAHLLYKVRLALTDENVQLIERCLKVLALMFDTDTIKIDTGNFNPSRVCKLYGTLAQKGANTAKRPHRMSRILGDVRPLAITPLMYIENLANEYPVEEPIRPKASNNYKPDTFDIEQWMDKYGIRYKVKEWNNATKYILDECPFDSSHKAPDSMIVKMNSGAIGFKCLHNHCQGYTWKDVRLKFEPNAYECTDADRRIEEGWKQHNRLKEKAEITEEAKRNEPIFLNAEMIRQLPEPEWEYIKTGVNFIDKKMRGLQKGCVTVLSGLRASAKSTIINQLILNSVQYGHTSVLYSGEMSNTKLMNWIYLQAAGKGYTQKYEVYDGYYCPDKYKEPISRWLGDKLWVYNNAYGNDFAKIKTALRKEIMEIKADICVIDNLMALDLTEYDQDKYDAQTKFVWELKQIAEDCNVHILFVAHPKKTQGFLRLDDISGTGNIGNIVDNALILHRVNSDFKKKTKEMYKWSESHDAYSGTNVIEVCKDREGGIQDEFIPLWYEPETKRLKNYASEMVIYDWERPDEGFIDVDENMEVPF